MNKQIVSTRPDSSDEAIIQEAKDRLELCDSFEGENRKEAIDDLNMLAGRNHWPDSVVRARELQKRPILTINKLPAFTDQVLNDGRMNKIAIKVKPAGGGATVELAETFNGLIRNIQLMSDADIAYQTAEEGAVNNGFGYFRVVTEYADDSTFDQDIFIKRIPNPLTVSLDPNMVSHDGRDCEFGFIRERISRRVFEKRYPGKNPPSPIGSKGEEISWANDDTVLIVEYWIKEPITRRIYLLSDKRTVEADEWDKVADDLKLQEKTIHLEPDPNNPQGPPI